jgi:fructokinase
VRIGIDLGGTKIEGVVLDGAVEIIRLRADTPRDDYEATLDSIVHLVQALESRTPLDSARGRPNPESRHPVGIGIPGTISATTGLVKNANSTWLIGRPLQADLEAKLGAAVRIANDANCFAVSEATDGAAAGASVVFGVILGTGVGGGVVVNGRVLDGANGIAGEWGHNPLPWATSEELPGPECYCGKHGCIETFLSGPGMRADHERRSGTDLLPPEIVARAAAGDVHAAATLARYEERVARALAAVVNGLDPDVIVLGGGMSNIERLYTTVPDVWRNFVFAAVGTEREPVRTQLRRAKHGASSGVRGAAWLWQ